MAVTVDAKCIAVTEISAVNGTTGKTSTNLTVGASATVLLASLCFDGSANLGSIAMHWDSTGTNVAMTQIGTTTYVAGVGQIALFGLASPVAGAKTLKATWTGTGTGYMASMSFIGTPTTVATAFTNFNSGTPTGTTGTFNITGASGNYGFAVNGNDNVTYTTFIHATSSTALYTDANENYSGVAYAPETGTTLAFTWAQGSSNQNVVAGCTIAAASSGTNASVTGVNATGAAGTVIAGVSPNDTGVTGSGGAGSLTTETDTNTLTGVIGTGGAGAPLSQIGSTDTGVSGSGGVGSLAGSSGGTMGGVGGTGQVGTGTASVGANIGGAAGTGAVGTLGTPGTVNGTIVGVGGNGQPQGLSDEIDVPVSGVAGHGRHGILTTNSPVITAPVTVGGPGDGEDEADAARQKWLEWSRKRRQKQKQLIAKPARVIPEKVEVAAVETPQQSLLERNLQSQRVQMMQQMVRDAAARIQEEDDEEAIALLLDA